MIEQVKKNISFIVIGVAIIICIEISIDNMINKDIYSSPNAPKFKLPLEISGSSTANQTQFPIIKKSVFLGEKKPVKAKVSFHKKKKRRLILKPLIVKAIMIQGKEKIANINGSLMKVGGYIHGRTILKIEKDAVLVTGPKGKKKIKIRN